MYEAVLAKPLPSLLRKPFSVTFDFFVKFSFSIVAKLFIRFDVIV
jgi:hypothetical protein